MMSYILLAAGIILAALGGDLFVGGSVGIARAARIPPELIGATVTAFAASSPELIVAITGALVKTPGVGVGNALGSNVVNVALVLGVALLFGSIRWPSDGVGRDYPVALLAPVVSAALFYNGELSRLRGFVLIGMFCVWLAAVVRDARRQRSASGEQEELGEAKLPWSVWQGALGLAALLAAGNLIVFSARSIAQRYGVDLFIIGATIVPIGTSAPELATMIAARLRGEDDVAIGAILGSSIFNSLLVVGTTLAIAPMHLEFRELALSLTLGFLSFALIAPWRSRVIDGRRSLILLMIYGVYLAMLWRSA